uniref:SHSP domain-containing protein n=2 Tax=Oryza sativa subsp. japonica TaxID=39947 RepID=Q10FT8_ORYSJ|nr:hypothetical protein [Oryza sativa Japonica Group]ABF97969.1 hypothetical protein LOC_Os03g45330 [Oryza sativa Japonica Group]
MGNSYSNVGSPTAAGYVQAPELPLHLCFFLVVLLVFLGFSWYMSYESAAERFANQARLLLMASPLALLLTPRTLRHSSRRCSSRRWAQPGTVFTIPVFPEQRGYFLKLGFITQRQHACTQYFNAATAAAAAAPPPPRRHGYANVDPRCEWTRTEDADTLVVDVSGFRKEELKVLYNTSRKLKVAGERRADGGQWARFLKMFPVPRSCDAGAIRAVMDNEEALLYVILPKGSSSSSSSSRDKKEDEHNVSSQPQGEAAMAPMADGPSSSSGGGGNLYIAQEDEEMGKIDEKEEVIATQDVPRTHGDVDDGNGRWFHLGVFAGLETAVRVHLEDVGVKHGKHLVDAVRDLLGGGDPGGVDVIHTLAEDGQELLIGSGVLDGAPG